MKVGRRGTALACVAGVVVAVGCGGSDEPDRPAPAKPATLAEFRRDAARICRDTAARFQQVPAPKRHDVPALRRWANERRAVQTDGLRRLQVLSAPDSVASDYADLLDRLDARQQTIWESQTKSDAGDPTGPDAVRAYASQQAGLDQVTTTLGLRACNWQ